MRKKSSTRLGRLDVANGRAVLLAAAGPKDQQTSRRGCAGHRAGRTGYKPGAAWSILGLYLLVVYSSASVGLLGRGTERNGQEK